MLASVVVRAPVASAAAASAGAQYVLREEVLEGLLRLRFVVSGGSGVLQRVRVSGSAVDIGATGPVRRELLGDALSASAMERWFRGEDKSDEDVEFDAVSPAASNEVLLRASPGSATLLCELAGGAVMRIDLSINANEYAGGVREALHELRAELS